MKPHSHQFSMMEQFNLIKFLNLITYTEFPIFLTH
mgnify:CR=1 FL=1